MMQLLGPVVVFALFQMCQCSLSVVSLVSSLPPLSNIFFQYLYVCIEGRVELGEFMQSLRDLGVHISPQHAEKALKR